MRFASRMGAFLVRDQVAAAPQKLTMWPHNKEDRVAALLLLRMPRRLALSVYPKIPTQVPLSLLPIYVFVSGIKMRKLDEIITLDFVRAKSSNFEVTSSSSS